MTNPDAVEISRPTIQFTARAQPTIVQFQRRSKRTGQWVSESFHPTQDELAAHEPAGTSPGYWGDAGVEAATLAYLRDEYGITNAVIVDPPAQPDEPVQPTRLDAAAAANTANTANTVNQA